MRRSTSVCAVFWILVFKGLRRYWDSAASRMVAESRNKFGIATLTPEQVRGCYAYPETSPGLLRLPRNEFGVAVPMKISGFREIFKGNEDV